MTDYEWEDDMALKEMREAEEREEQKEYIEYLEAENERMGKILGIIKRKVVDIPFFAICCIHSLLGTYNAHLISERWRWLTQEEFDLLKEYFK